MKKNLTQNIFFFLFFLFQNGFAQNDTTAINHQIRAYEKKIKNLMTLEKSYEIIDAYISLIQQNKAYLETYNPEKLATYYLELSFYYSDVHNQKYEIEYTKKAIDLMEKTQKYQLRNYLTAYNDWYYYVHNYGDPKQSKVIYDRFKKVYKDLIKSTNQSQSNINYAVRIFDKMLILEYLNENQFDKAIAKLAEFYQKIGAAKGEDRVEDIGYYMSCYDAFTYKYYENNDFANAITYLKKLRAQAIEFGLPFFEMKANALLGSTYYYLNQFENGNKHADLALQNFTFPPFSSSKYSIQVIKGLNLSGLQQHDAASKLVSQIIDEIVAKNTGIKTSILGIDEQSILSLNSHNYINIFATSSLIFIKKYKNSSQKIDLQKAEKLAVIAALLFQEFYKKGEYNSTLSRLQNKITETLVFICSQNQTTAQQKKKLLNLIERNVSQHLFKEVQKKVLLSNPALAIDYTDLEQLQNEKMYLEGLVDANNDSIAIKLNKINQKIAESKKNLQQKFPNFLQVDADFNIQNVQQKLTDDEQIWKYYVADEHVYKLIVQKNELNMTLLTTISKLKPLVNQFLQQLKKPTSNLYEISLQLKQLLDAKHATNDRIIIIPDNFLSYIPFEILLQNTSKNIPVISYQYSFPMWLFGKQKPVNSVEVILASFAPTYKQHQFFANQPIQTLPFATKEATEIADLFGGKTFTGNLATKENFLNQSKTFSVYHFAMHSFLFEEDFSKSCLLFANNQPLYFSELYKYYIPADLLVLSACNTGNGAIVNGEGIMSLARAFTYTGVKSSLVSLWQIPDKETYELMLLFYKNLTKGYAKDKALAIAKQQFIKENPLKSHPYFWAGFIINGDTTHLVKPSIFTNKYLIFTGLILCVAIFVVLKKYYFKSSNKAAA